MDITLKEADFGLDPFKSPKLLKEEEALARTVLLILFGKPGCFPSIPELGMYIQSYFYEFNDRINITEIKVQLAYQCSLVSNYITSGDLDVGLMDLNGKQVLYFIIPSLSTESNNVLIIGVTVNEDGSVIYNYELMRSDFDESDNNFFS